MIYRTLGATGLLVSEIGLGGEWLEKQTPEAVMAIIDRCDEHGINIVDCWMAEPNVRRNIGAALHGRRDRWVIEGHIGSVWQNGQYNRTRDMALVKPAFEDLLRLLDTDYLDLGMMHFIDQQEELERVLNGEFYAYMLELKRQGRIRHIGMSTHNPLTAQAAIEAGAVENILFSINPAYDMLPASEDLNVYFVDDYGDGFDGIAPERARLYSLCEERQIGITVMKGYAGGRLFNPMGSPFGVALTPVQCLHYALTRPGVASVMVGYTTVEHVDQAVAYETATAEQKDYASVLSAAPRNSYRGQCTYCGHCAPCPSNIDIPMMNKLYDLALMREDTPESLREHYRVMRANANDCIACAACEGRCPFGVHVVERMAKARELFR